MTSIAWNIFFFYTVFTSPILKDEDPFRKDNLPADLGYKLQVKDGVVFVYPDDDALAKGKPKDLNYPDFHGFVDDMNFLITLIAQGPV